MKQKKLWMLIAILNFGTSVFASCGNSDHDTDTDTKVLREWLAGQTVSSEAVEAFGGVDRCFAAEPIPDGVWARMQGRTYRENPYIGRDDLRHVRALHWDYDGQMHVGEMVVNAVIADRVVRSKHARGLAIDINTLYNPYYKDRADGTRFVQPATAGEYCNRTGSFPYKIDHEDLCFRLFTGAGFEWGGDWTSCKDFQHFELIE